jgi:Ni/Co efflux regulator RcnB
MSNIQLDDVVEWTSQAAGYTRTKVGVVVGLVPVGHLPGGDRFPSLYRGAGVGMPRDHISYVVRVPGRGVYWPVAKKLRKVQP